jgi:hypothetical protein
MSRITFPTTDTFLRAVLDVNRLMVAAIKHVPADRHTVDVVAGQTDAEACRPRRLPMVSKTFPVIA